MIAYLIQPIYSLDTADADRFFEYKIKMLDEIPPDADIVVLPEYSDVPVSPRNNAQLTEMHAKYFDRLMQKCAEIAKRCGCIVFVNALDGSCGEWRNTTYAIDEGGEVIGKYYKTHIPPAEKKIDVAYSYTEDIKDYYTLDYKGVRYAFLTCYDFYFYEGFPKLAGLCPDVIIGAALQRSDTPYISETICRFLAYNTSAYVLRASVSLGEGSRTCGGSMAVDTEGKTLSAFENQVGVLRAEFDPHKKFKKPGGFGNPDCKHCEYIEKGRRPWQYRQCGSSVVVSDAEAPYPRLCAINGLSKEFPQNTLAALGAAVGVGAEEIAFDLSTDDNGRLIIDSKGTDFEQVLCKFACRTVMNVNITALDGQQIEKAVTLIRRYDGDKHCYLTSTSADALTKCRSLVTEIAVCLRTDDPVAAAEIGAQKVLYNHAPDAEALQKAHSLGLICCAFADDKPSADRLTALGADCILTNDYSAAK